MIDATRLQSKVLEIALAALLLLCLGCHGYTRVQGTIRDASGAPIAGASVVFSAKGRAFPKQTKSSADGTYSVSSTHARLGHVPLTLVVSKEGYRSVEMKFESSRKHTWQMDIVLFPAESGAKGNPQTSPKTK